MSEQVENADNDDADDAFQTPKYWDAFYDDEEVYDWYSAAGAMYAACRRELRRLKGRGRVLDVGCGTASHLAALAKYADVTGVDFSETVINANKARQEGVTYLVEDASSLSSLEDNSFDVVLDKGCLDCFVSAPDASFARRDAFLRSLQRVLDADGVYLCMPVCGVDVVTLLTSGAAKRAKPDVAGAISDKRDAWETQRSGSNGCAFEILQIVASQQKHLFRCAHRLQRALKSGTWPRPRPRTATTFVAGGWDLERCLRAARMACAPRSRVRIERPGDLDLRTMLLP